MRTLYRGATLIDARGGAPVPNSAVAVDGCHIEAVGPADDFVVDPDTAVVDVTGKTIMPGLINMHDHLVYKEAIGGRPSRFLSENDVTTLTLFATRNVLKLLRRGVTTVRDMATVHGIVLALRDAVNRGELPGPRILACNKPISCTGGHASHSLTIEADGPDAVRKAAREQLKLGTDFVKVMASHDPVSMPGREKTRPEFTPSELHAAINEAHQWGKPTTCHCMGTIALRNVIEAGIDVIEHGIYLDDELAELMASRHIYLTPTYSAYSRQTMNPKYGRGKEWAEAHAPLVEPQTASVKAALRAGITIVNGTDSTGRYAEEVELLRAAGMDRMESLLACTRYAAEALGLDDQIGTLEPGKLADIVVLDSDPLADPYALEQVYLVVKEGKGFRPSDINLLLEES